MGEAEKDEESVGALLGRLAADGKSYARAEIAYYRALAAQKAGAARKGLVMAIAALAIACSALTALLVGAILALATIVGPGLATLIVIVAALGLAALLGWGAYRHFTRMMGGRE